MKRLRKRRRRVRSRAEAWPSSEKLSRLAHIQGTIIQGQYFLIKRVTRLSSAIIQPNELTNIDNTGYRRTKSAHIT
ncbi:hypothetical protein CHELA1G11_14038 [Hyphomicrobiales bacterium]|nr:hypothetical protein CHELA1G2_10276 [Hyphomicrobiales bacterium]CAH1675786.1 hypothetical protein CHELA1G11_14038 [Hyphomicrobiales bacterium]